LTNVFFNGHQVFDGASNLNVSWAAAQTPTDLSLCLWARPSAFPGVLASVGDAFSPGRLLTLGFNATGGLLASFFADNQVLDASFDLNTWHHYCVVYTSASRSRVVVRDGVTFSAATTAWGFNSTAGMRIGSQLGGTQFFRGGIGTHRIFL
jgi:hypothetical protein